jgi:hypothetical protein
MSRRIGAINSRLKKAMKAMEKTEEVFFNSESGPMSMVLA